MPDLNLDELERDDDADGRDDDTRDEAPDKTTRRRSERGRRAGVAARSGKRRPPQEARIREALEAVALWISDRGDDELGGTLERDAPKMARVLGDLAGTNPLAKKAVAVLADILEPVRAFGPTLRIVWRRVLARREARLAELEQELADDEPVGDVTRQPAPEPVVAEPWRIGAP